MDTSLFDYDLPSEMIAQHPPAVRGTSRMMVLPLSGDAPKHLQFSALPELLSAGDCLVFNDTRVIPARLLGVRPTGGRSEVFLLKRLHGDDWEALVRPAKRMSQGTIVHFGDLMTATVLEPPEMGMTSVRLEYDGSFEETLGQVGITPLPPYIKREVEAADDRQRYQTVYAKTPGAVAAPTAGLHFTDAVLEEVAARGIHTARVTLHVGLGTFSPISSATVEAHTMHSEQYAVSEEAAETINSARRAGGRIVAVGTTAVRTLESCSDAEETVHAGSGDTSIYIMPGYEFKIVDAILTNFHLPRSSLIVMISALVGRERILAAYEAAKKHGYRFYSYGDCMLIL